MKKEMSRRFLTLFKMFRLKKHGETYVIKKDDFAILSTSKTKSLIETDGKINSKLDQIEKYLMKDKDKDDDVISDLHTVNEDYDDEADDEMNPAAFVHNKKEYEDHVFQVIEHDTVLSEIKKHVAKIKKVQTFLLTIILRKRFLKKQKSAIIV